MYDPKMSVFNPKLLINTPCAIAMRKINFTPICRS
jgi:hypothetical protein